MLVIHENHIYNTLLTGPGNNRDVAQAFSLLHTNAALRNSSWLLTRRNAGRPGRTCPQTTVATARAPCHPAKHRVPLLTVAAVSLCVSVSLPCAASLKVPSQLDRNYKILHCAHPITFFFFFFYFFTAIFINLPFCFTCTMGWVFSCTFSSIRFLWIPTA